jgi:hypothetical protein
MKTHAQIAAHLWSAIDDIEDLTRGLEEIACLPVSDEQRRATLSLVRRLLDNARYFKQAFNDGPAFDFHGPWRPVNTTDIGPILSQIIDTLAWTQLVVDDSTIYTNAEVIAVTKPKVLTLAVKMKQLMLNYGIKWEDL